MDLESFVSLKTSSELENLSNEILTIVNLFSTGKKIFKNNNSKGNQILKNPKFQVLKDKIENKVNLVLNKLSELNFNNILIEFIESFGKISEQDYIIVQKTFYQKMQSDISFVKIYIEFFKIISNIYNNIYNLKSDFIFKIIESKFMHDYTNLNFCEDTDFLKEYDDNSSLAPELKRINNLVIIKNFISTSLLNNEIDEQLSNIILEQTNYYADIYFWYQNKNIDIKTKDNIKNKIKSNSLPMREKVLLENLINDNIQNKSIVPVVSNNTVSINTDTLNIESENIIEEYLLVQSIDEVKIFIDTRCKDAIMKNKFCHILFTKYFENSQENSNLILELSKLLVKKQILFKSNLSRGILIIYNNWSDTSLDYNNATKKMKDLLTCLKNMGITKNLETILKTYKIEYIQT
jgi:hypothetical protein